MPRTGYKQIKRAALLVAVMLALGAGEAQAHTIVLKAQNDGRSYQRWVNEAKVPTPDITVRVQLQYGALLAYDGQGSIWIFPKFVGWGGFYEALGMVFDQTLLTDDLRNRFLSIIDKPSMPWIFANPSSGGGSYFYDIYSLCARLPQIDPHWSYSVSTGYVAGSRLLRGCHFIQGFLEPLAPLLPNWETPAKTGSP